MTITSNIGMASLGIGMLFWGILSLVGTVVPTLIVALWLIGTGLFILVGR